MSKGPTLDPKRRWIFLPDSSNIGAVRFYRTHENGWLDIIFKVQDYQHQNWDIKCNHCRPKIFYRYKVVLIEDFVDMLFDESSGKFFNREIKAQCDAPEKLDLVWP